MLQDAELANKRFKENIETLKEECDGQQERISDLNAIIRDLNNKVS